MNFWDGILIAIMQCADGIGVVFLSGRGNSKGGTVIMTVVAGGVPSAWLSSF